MRGAAGPSRARGGAASVHLVGQPAARCAPSASRPLSCCSRALGGRGLLLGGGELRLTGLQVGGERAGLARAASTWPGASRRAAAGGRGATGAPGGSEADDRAQASQAPASVAMLRGMKRARLADFVSDHSQVVNNPQKTCALQGVAPGSTLRDVATRQVDGGADRDRGDAEPDPDLAPVAVAQ